MNELAYGVDFGTTNSAIGVLSLEGKPVVIPIEGNSKMMPSTLYFPNYDSMVYVGAKAISEYLEWRDGRFIQSVKRVLPFRNFTGTLIRATRYEASDLVAIILERLKKAGDRYTGCDVRRVVLGRPVEFSADRTADKLAEERLREAAEMAGFEEVCFQHEPVAAALAYEISLQESRLTLIADLGGGTSDFTLIELGPSRIARQDKKVDVIASRGLTLAGDVFDAKLMHAKVRSLFGEGSTHEGFFPGTRLSLPSSILADLCDKGRIIHLYHEGLRKQLEDILRTTDDPNGIRRLIKLIEHNLGFAIFSAVEQGKKELSSSEMTRICLNEKDINVDTVVTRDEFEHLISSSVTQLSNCVDQLLQEGQVSPNRVDTVYLTGGSSLVPAVRQMLAKKFSEHKLVFSPDPFLSVITGLIISTGFMRT